ncbi:MAG: DNA methyltransferase [Planctomycetota bacterium]
MSNGNGTLTKLTEATRMLAEIKTVSDARQVANLAEAARQYARKAGLGLEAQNNAAEIKIKAQWKEGQILAQMKKSGELREGKTPKLSQDGTVTVTLDELGITRNESSRTQQMGELPEAKLETTIAEELGKEKELTTTTVLGVAKSERKQAERTKRAKAGKSVALPCGVDLRVGDFRERVKDIPDNSVDLVFTDPPYDRESIPLYEDLAREAARVLKPGGSLICYAGHYAIPEILNLMTPHLRYWWTLCCKHNGNSARLTGVNVFVAWKPMLWFVKDTRGGNLDFVSDLIESSLPTKDDHDWQQSDAEARYYIEHLTNEGDTILDPFAGSGTTLIAAHQLNRNSIGIEIDEDNANIAKSRIAKN